MRLHLFEVTNGYIGESYVRCLVIAPSEQRAIELARPKYAAASKQPDYAARLSAELLWTSKHEHPPDDEWVGGVTDG